MRIRERRTLNKPLLRKLAAKLRRLRHEDHFDQRAWLVQTDCGTAACIAGHTVLLAGVKLLQRPMIGEPIMYAERICASDGGPLTISSAARRLLGLGKAAAYRLFSPSPRCAWRGGFGDRWSDMRAGFNGERPSRIAADYLDAIADGKVKP